MQRRGFLWAAGSVAAAGSIAWVQRNNLTRAFITRPVNEGVTLSPAIDPNQEMCRLTPQQVDGPFFVRSPMRIDIREDRTGLPLDLQLQVVNAENCQPVEGALVEIWHCDSAGRYSAYPEDINRHPFDTIRFIAANADGTGHVPPVNGKTYLRGAQASNKQGLVNFSTILPGWYEPRVPHIHVKVFVGEDSPLVSQLYFPAVLTDDVYANHADYAPHGMCPYHPGNDDVLGNNPNAEGLQLQPVATVNGLQAACRLGIS